VDLEEDSSGTCQLRVEPAQDLEKASGVRVQLEGGKVVACDCGLGEERGSYAVGTTGRWLAAIKEGAIDELHFGGSGGDQLAERLVRGMHLTLMQS
jgi:hypothetical protein